MMDRRERLHYEILDCALNRAIDARGYPTTVRQFVARLRNLFPDLQETEFTGACHWLTRQEALHLQLMTNGNWRDYRGEEDYEALSNQEFWLKGTMRGQNYFRQLSDLIEAPSG